MKNILLLLFLIFPSYNSIAQNTLNYSANSTSSSNLIEINYNDSVSIDYVVGEAISTNSYLITIPLANLVDSFDNIYQYDAYYFKIFPNPATNYIIISFPISDNYDIDLLDNAGKTIGNICSDEINSDENCYLSIEDFNLPSGPYYLHIQSKKINTFLSFIIQK
ncbi:MAG: T9SS type A sorting domain-containing protein [Bacteroidetes bacterium]|nr:T9SS type A sorting domain-containing protein [Bacteroidota bacterium]